MAAMQDLPISNSSFADIRGRNQVYVDKTEGIFELAKNKRQLFLARPRRFGKSLLISTLHALFAQGIGLFKGLWIADHWRDHTYAVLQLDFSGLTAQSAEAFEAAAVRKFSRKATQAKLLQTQQPIPTLADFVAEVCSGKALSSIVLLIDEYDAPLNANLSHPETFDAIQEVLRNFYGAIKEYSGNFRLVFITGVARFKDVTIFSAGSAIQDISLEPKFAAILGYTEAEIRRYFHAHLIRSAALLHACPSQAVTQDDIDQVVRGLKSHYDGYCFDSQGRQHVFQTWSVLNFFESDTAQWKDYWYESGGISTLLVEFFRQNGALGQTDMADMTVEWETFNHASNLARMPLSVLLCQCGYYTIKAVTPRTVTLGLPNLELQHAHARLNVSRFFQTQQLGRADKQTVRFSHCQQSSAWYRDFFNAVLETRYSRNRLTNEYQVNDLIRVYCLAMSMDVRGEVVQGSGRADLTFEFLDWRLVIEMKFARSHTQVSALLEQALVQLHERSYGAYAPQKTVRRIAMVFSEAEQRIVAADECTH